MMQVSDIDLGVKSAFKSVFLVYTFFFFFLNRKIVYKYSDMKRLQIERNKPLGFVYMELLWFVFLSHIHGKK